MHPSNLDQSRVEAVLSMAEAEAIGGMPFEAVAGIRGIEGSGDGFRTNRSFAPFMHHVIRVFGPDDPDLREAAREQGEGSLRIIDFRTPEGIMGNVPPEDIIGAFEVKGGRLGEYFANDQHQILTNNGLVQLPPPLRELHRRELMRLKVGEPDAAQT